MTQLSMSIHHAVPEVCEPEPCTARELAAYLTATVVYSLSGATVFLLATFIRNL